MAARRRFTLRHRTHGKTRRLHHRGREELAHTRAHQGYLELTIVGDFDPESIVPDLLATFGALPARESAPADLARSAQGEISQRPGVKDLHLRIQNPQGIAFTVWRTAGMRGNQKEFRRLNLLAEHPQRPPARGDPRETRLLLQPERRGRRLGRTGRFGYLISQSIGKPEDLETLLNTMREEADQLATEGANEDELDRALKPTLGMLEKSLRDNSYWLKTVLSQSQADPTRLDLARNRDADYRSISLKEINALAKKHLAAENALLITIKPAE
jgi:zinc protease